MKMKCRGLPISILVFFVFVSEHTRAEYLLQGHIRDAETGKVLPAATVQIVDTYRGTIANESGEYALDLKGLPAVIRVMYIGYATQEHTIADSSVNRLDIALKPTPFEMAAMVVTPGDLAVRIMREVIRRKQEWMPRIESYKADVYSRQVLEKEGEIAIMGEVVSEYYWDKEKGHREVVKSQRQTENMAEEKENYGSAMEEFVNLYQDDIPFVEHRIIGPTHPDALRHYRFKVVDQRRLDDKIVYDISVEPRSKLQAALVGRISVLDQEYALLEVDLKPSKSTLTSAVPLPLIEHLDIAFKQQFRGFEQGVWLPVDYQSDLDVKISMIGLAFPLFSYNIHTRLANYDVNIAVPDSFYAREGRLIVDTLAIEQDSLFTRYADEMIPLTAREIGAYETIDTSMTPEKIFQPTGFLARFLKSDEEDKDNNDRAIGEEGGRKEPSKNKGGEAPRRKGRGRTWWKFRPEFQPELWYNRVDAPHLGLVAKERLPANLRLELLGGYNAGIEKAFFGGEVRRSWDRAAFGVVYRRGTRQRYGSDTYNLISNSFQMLLGVDDYFDYYWSEEFGARIDYRFARWQKTGLSLAFRQEEHTSLAKNADFTLLDRDKTLRSNPPVDPGQLRALSLAFERGEKYHPFGIEPNRRVGAEIEYSADWMGGDFSFGRYQVTVDWHFKTFWKRRFTPNALDLRLVAGTSTGDLPLQRFGALDASVGFLSPFGTFRSLHGHPYEGEHFAALFWEHNFKTVPFEYLGLWGLAQRGMGLALHGASGRTWIGDERRAALPYNPRYVNGFHHEIGVSLLIYHFFRLDATRRLDQSAWGIGVNLARFDFED